MPQISKERLEKLEMAIDRLDNFVASLTGFTTLPDSIHVGALREGLPDVARQLRAALPRS